MQLYTSCNCPPPLLLPRIRFASLNNTTTKTEFWCGTSKGKCLGSVAITPKLSPQPEPSSVVRSTLKALENLMLDPRLDCFQQNMLGPKMIIGDPSVDLGIRESGRIIRKQIGGAQNLRTFGKASLKNKPLSIKDKISEWEGKKETQQVVKEDLSSFLGVMEKMTRESAVTKEVNSSKRPLNRQLECKGSNQEDEKRTGPPKSAGQPTERKVDLKGREAKPKASVGKDSEPKDGKKEGQKENLSVLRQVKKLEQALKGGSAELQPQLPGTYYSPQCLQERVDEGQSPSEGQDSISKPELSKRLFGSEPEANEPIFGTLEEVKAACVKGQSGNEENVYTEPGLPEKKPFINPLPKPRRTFKHEDEEGWVPPVRNKRNLPPLPSIPPPPLPSSPPPSAVSRRLRNGKHKTNADHRYLSVCFAAAECGVSYYCWPLVGGNFLTIDSMSVITRVVCFC